MPSEETTYRQSVRESLARIEAQVSYTNGKVRKHEKFFIAIFTALAILLIERYPEMTALFAHLIAGA